MVTSYHSTRQMPKAPTRLTPAKARVALRSDIARVERWLEVCPPEDREKAQANLEHLKRALRGLQG